MYKENLTQEERIMRLLRKRGSEGVKIWEFMMPRNQGGLGIAQYNARIYGLRKKGHIIKSIKSGRFVLVRDVEAPEPEKVEQNKLW